MAPPTVPIGEPTRLRAGDSAIWDILAFSQDDYGYFSSTDGWALTYQLIGSSVTVAAAAATQGSGWRTTLTTAQTTSLWDGGGLTDEQAIRWVAYLTKSTERYTIRNGSLVLSPDPSTLPTGVTSLAASMVALWRTAITAFATNNGIQSYSIGSRSVLRGTPDTMRRELTYWERRLEEERRPGGFGRAVASRFTRPRSKGSSALFPADQ